MDVAEIGSTTVTELVESVLVNCSSYSFSSLSNNACDVYTFIVIPTDGANNGTFNRSVTGYSLNRKGIYPIAGNYILRGNVLVDFVV